MDRDRGKKSELKNGGRVKATANNQKQQQPHEAKRMVGNNKNNERITKEGMKSWPYLNLNPQEFQAKE
ncbi:GL13462 [Drosophila persimilis]|uniref:GL13462 n=1 Tax=Drosophila persimilis TaxID=7234 RepID=B4IRR9_DROPE|nr:GL13462 [Drosophila persimilis]